MPREGFYPQAMGEGEKAGGQPGGDTPALKQRRGSLKPGQSRDKTGR